MGWNSWDSYGATIDEAQFRASAAWVAGHLKPFGYEYVTIDMEWYEADPIAEGNKNNAKLFLDGNGRYIPDPARFPSSVAGAGFAPVAAYVHSLGLKFGIHILQGIPKEAVADNLPIAGSAAHAKDTANTVAGCVWNPDNYDLAVSAAGQDYYDSVVKLYAGWGVDLIKIDCIASRPYKGDEIRMFHEAMVKSGRPIVLSLSPGEAPIDEAANLQRYAQQWRISDDIWDLWHSDHSYPQGVNDQFARAAKWIGTEVPGHWPDADMLPLGRLGPAPGWGKPRNTNLTHDEQRTLMNLWCIFRSPLMYGGDPAATDDWTLGLLTNYEVLAVDQHSRNNRNVVLTDALAVWTAEPENRAGWYVAVFNRQDTAQKLDLSWKDLGIPAGGHVVRDLWSQQEVANQASLQVTLPAHASALVQVFRPKGFLPR
jgi:alpha-galactosidase